ncbi:hypothetical protein PVAND_016840 [Polypedilum vanderplanki]|uniref:Uncharacterized protein n=1 Tax=Polypedilum vanderplanki TaxID=319348 RepID=A0A9J6BGK9_POLVA|nr:hypothetical protein PVAND_016840 [Polypedilum vanderplanki]
MRLASLNHIKQNEWMHQFDWNLFIENRVEPPFKLKVCHAIGKSQNSIDFHNNGFHKIVENIDKSIQVSTGLIQNQNIQPNEVELMEVVENEPIANIPVVNNNNDKLILNARFINVPEEKTTEQLMQMSKYQLRVYFKAFIIELSDKKILCAMAKCSKSRFGGKLATSEA